MDKHLPFLLIFLAAIDLLPIRQQAIQLNQYVEAEDDYFSTSVMPRRSRSAMVVWVCD